MLKLKKDIEPDVMDTNQEYREARRNKDGEYRKKCQAIEFVCECGYKANQNYILQHRQSISHFKI